MFRALQVFIIILAKCGSFFSVNSRKLSKDLWTCVNKTIAVSAMQITFTSLRLSNLFRPFQFKHTTKSDFSNKHLKKYVYVCMASLFQLFCCSLKFHFSEVWLLSFQKVEVHWFVAAEDKCIEKKLYLFFVFL